MAKMNVEPITASILATVIPWWPLRHEGEMPEGILPPCGLVASDDSGPLAAMWLYQPIGCKVAILDWLITRPGLPPHTSRAAARALLDAMEAIARADGATRLFCAVTRSQMFVEACACGFHVVSHAHHLAKALT